MENILKKYYSQFVSWFNVRNQWHPSRFLLIWSSTHATDPTSCYDLCISPLETFPIDKSKPFFITLSNIWPWFWDHMIFNNLERIRHLVHHMACSSWTISLSIQILIARFSARLEGFLFFSLCYITYVIVGIKKEHDNLKKGKGRREILVKNMLC